MSAQPLLFSRTSESRFLEFHRKNPKVYELLVQYARRARERGYKTYGIGALWEIVRWDWNVFLKTAGTELKLNNNFRSRYARLIMQQEPDLEGFFHLRELHS